MSRSPSSIGECDGAAGLGREHLGAWVAHAHEVGADVRHPVPRHVDRADEELRLEPAPEPAVPEEERIVVADSVDDPADARRGAHRGLVRDPERHHVHELPEIGVGAVGGAGHAPRACQHSDPVVALALAGAEEEVAARDLVAQQLRRVRDELIRMPALERLEVHRVVQVDGDRDVRRQDLRVPLAHGALQHDRVGAGQEVAYHARRQAPHRAGRVDRGRGVAHADLHVELLPQHACALEGADRRAGDAVADDVGAENRDARSLCHQERPHDARDRARAVDVEGGAERLGKRGIGTGAGCLHGRSSLGELGLGEPDSGAESCRERQGFARVRLGLGPLPARVRLSAPPDDARHPGVQRLGRRRVLHERTVERRVAEHRGQQRDARAHPPAFLLERRRVSCGADTLVDRDQDGRADHAVPRQREAPAPVGLGEGVARAPVRWAGGQQRIATSGKRPPIDPQHLPPLRQERRGDRPALECECVARGC